MKKIVLVLHNIRSTYNVGSITRTAEGLGVNKIYATGYTPHTSIHIDGNTPPHVRIKMRREIKKTALGAEELLEINHHNNIFELLQKYRESDYEIVGLEQNSQSIPIARYKSSKNLVLVLGEEVRGIPDDVLRACELFIEIPMLGRKESFNVSVATGIALYELRRSDIFTAQ